MGARGHRALALPAHDIGFVNLVGAQGKIPEWPINANLIFIVMTFLFCLEYHFALPNPHLRVKALQYLTRSNYRSKLCLTLLSPNSD